MLLRNSALLATAFFLLSGCEQNSRDLVYSECTFTSPTGTIIDLNVEVRDDEAGRAEGLMYRKSIEEDEGMLFVWPDSQQRHMWMKNTLIPLDMVFLNNNRVVGIVENTVPMSESILTVEEPANQVLEVKGGMLLKWGVSSQWHLACSSQD